MTVREFTSKCASIVENIDKKYKIERDPQLSFTQLMEEVGELAKEINRNRLRGNPPKRKDLEGEFADVLLQLCILAKMHNIDLEIAVENKVLELKQRHQL